MSYKISRLILRLLNNLLIAICIFNSNFCLFSLSLRFFNTQFLIHNNNKQTLFFNKQLIHTKDQIQALRIEKMKKGFGFGVLLLLFFWLFCCFAGGLFLLVVLCWFVGKANANCASSFFVQTVKNANLCFLQKSFISLLFVRQEFGLEKERELKLSRLLS